MLHYELGDLSAPKDQLIDALRLAPDDAWSYVVLGNIFTREQDWDYEQKVIFPHSWMR